MNTILSPGDLVKLTRWNTPTIYNGWEAITKHERTGAFFNLEETVDFMPQMGVMVGYAVTCVFEPSNPAHQKNTAAPADYRAYVASVTGVPKIVVLQDYDKPKTVGSFWGEVNANTHRALGCVGTITDGAIRDVNEMTAAGFHAIARRLCVGHAYSTPVKWNCPVDVFGITVCPGDLIHADKHGFMVIPPEDQKNLLDALLFMDYNECETVIPAGKFSSGESMEHILDSMKAASSQFGKNTAEKFKKTGEW